MRWFRRAPQGVVPKEEMRRFLPGDPVIVEAGAHIGIDTAELGRMWPDGIVYAFEPVPDLFRQLQDRVQSLQNVRPLKLGLGSESGSARIYVSGGHSDGSSSLLKPKEHLAIHPNVTFDESIPIETVTLDDWARAEGIEKVDFLWLDLQGFELAVLQHATDVLDQVAAIYTEVHLVETYEGVPVYGELRTWLEDHGFEVVREELPWEDGGNVLFARA
jgi:FkbM family methyltransferase